MSPGLSSQRTPPRWLTSLIVVFAVLAALCYGLTLITTHPVLFPAGPALVDILVYKGRFTLYHTAKFFTSRAYSAFAYPAGSAPIYEAFYHFADPIRAFCLLAATATVAALAGAFVYLRHRQATKLLIPLVIAIAFPLVFLIQRANIEMVLWIFTAAGLLLYRRGLLISAAILFGAVAATKLYPIFLLGLFLKPAATRTRQDFPAFATGLVTFLVIMTAALVHSGPTILIAARGFFTGVNRFQDHYVDTVSRVEIAFDHCLFSPVKYWAYSNHASPAPYTHLYFLIAGAVALLLFLRVRSLPFLNRAVFLTAAMVALPPVSFTYTLVHLYVPLLLLVGVLATSRDISVTASAALTTILFLMLPIMSISAVYPLPTGPIQSGAIFVLLLLPALKPWPSKTHPNAA